MIAGLFATLFGRLLGRRRGAVAATLAIAAYTLLVGASASVVRAALMGGLSLFAGQVGRRQDGLNSLAVVAALMAVFNPQIPWDVGFQLSFAATLGLVLFAGPLTQGFQRLIPPGGGIHPVHPGRPGGDAANRDLSLSAPVAGRLAGQPARPAGSTGGDGDGRAGGPAGAGLAAGRPAGSGAGLALCRLHGPGGGAAGQAARRGFGPGASEPAGRSAGLYPPVRRDLGCGTPASLDRSPEAEASPGPRSDHRSDGLGLADGPGCSGRPAAPGASGRGQRGWDPDPDPSQSSCRRPPGRRQLDWLVVAATGEEQLGALPDTWDRFPPQDVLWAGPHSGSPPAQALQERFSAKGITPLVAQTGQALNLGSGAKLRVMAAGKCGAVLLLEWEGFQALLPVGQDFDTLEALQVDPLLVPVEALLLAEGGYAPANPPEWIEKLQPKVVLLSVAAGDREGRPDAETLEAVQGYSLLRTDRNGWIEITTDGEGMWVEVEKR